MKKIERIEFIIDDDYYQEIPFIEPIIVSNDEIVIEPVYNSVQSEEIEISFGFEREKDYSQEIIEPEELIEKNSFKEQGIDYSKDNIDEDNIDNKSKEEKYHFLGSNKTTLKKSIYIGFNTRVAIYSILIVLLLVGSIVSIIAIYNASKKYEIKYSEESSVLYDFCDINGACLSNEQAKGMLLANANGIKLNYLYNVDISDVITYDVDYYIESDFSIADANDTDIVLERKKELLVSNKTIKDTSDNININETVYFDFKKYLDELNQYIEKHPESVKSKLTVSLYLQDTEDTTKLSSFTINLDEANVNPTVQNTINSNQSTFIEKDAWTDTNKVLVVVCIISGVCILLLIIRLSNLLVQAFVKKDKYQKELNRILKEYDSDIVIARDGYVSIDNKKVIKVSEFEELIDAKDTLQKPIIYVRINDIKSKFIVEDEECIYEYTLKDLNF